MIVVRYADDLVAGFEHEDDARRFLDAMRVRLEEFALSLHPDPGDPTVTERVMTVMPLRSIVSCFLPSVENFDTVQLGRF
jgi:hypothetical protein